MAYHRRRRRFRGRTFSMRRRPYRRRRSSMRRRVRSYRPRRRVFVIGQRM